MQSNAFKIYMLAIVSFLVGTSEFIIAGILDKVAADLNVSISAAGQLITVFSLTYAFGTPLLMAATARMDRRKLLIWSLVFFVVGNALAVALPGFVPLIVSRIVLALSTGVFVVTALTVASNLAPVGKQGSAIATVVMGFSTALIIGVPAGRVLASAYDWLVTFGALGALGLLAIAAIALSIPRTDGEEPVPLREQVKLLGQPRIAAALAITFFWISGYSIVYTFISPFLLEVTGMSGELVSAGLFAFGIASLLGSKLGGYSTDKYGVGRTLIGGMLLHAASLTLLAMFPGSPAVVFGLLMAWAFTAWSSGPTQQYYLLTLAPAASGIMLSLNTSVLQVAMAAGAGFGGVVVDRLSLYSISWIGAVSVGVAALTAAVSLGLTRSAARSVRAREEGTPRLASDERVLRPQGSAAE